MGSLNAFIDSKDRESLQFADELIGLLRRNRQAIVPFIGSGITSEIYGTWPDFLRSFVPSLNKNQVLENVKLYKLLTEKDKKRFQHLFINQFKPLFPRLSIEAEVDYLQELAKAGLYPELLEILGQVSGEDVMAFVKQRFTLDHFKEHEQRNSQKFQQVWSKLWAIHSLRTTLFVTTNVNSVLQYFLQKARGARPRVVFGSEPAKFGSIWPSSDDVIFAIHGDLEDESSLVLFRDQYDRLTSDIGYLQAIERLLQSHHLIFLGYGLSSGDAYLSRYLESVGIRLRGNTGPHFVFEQRKKLAADQLRFEYLRLSRKKFGLRYIVYDDHAHLAELISAIARLAEESHTAINLVEKTLGARRRVSIGKEVQLGRKDLDVVYKDISSWLKTKGSGAQRWIERFAVSDFAGYSWKDLLEGPKKLPPQIRAANQKIAEASFEWMRSYGGKSIDILELGFGYLTTLEALIVGPALYVEEYSELSRSKSPLLGLNRKATYCGVDLNIHAVDHARKKLLGFPYSEVFQSASIQLHHRSSADIFSVLHSKKIDLAIASFSLHHCRRIVRRRIYSNLERKLRVGGAVVLADPTGYSRFNRSRIFTDPEIAIVEFPSPDEVDYLEKLFSRTKWWAIVNSDSSGASGASVQLVSSRRIKELWFQLSFFGFIFFGVKK